MKGGKNNMKGGIMVKYTGGAAPADDGCGGWRGTVRTKTDIIAFFIIAATPSMTTAANDWIRNTEYGGQYDLTLSALGQIFDILDNLAADLAGRRDMCSSMSDVALGLVGFKNCHSGETRMRGVISHIMRFIQTRIGTDENTVWLTGQLGAASLLTSLRNYISNLLANLICTFYYFTKKGTVETWRVIKIILSTTAEFAYNAGVGASSMALAMGGGLVKYFSNLPQKLKNDVPRDMDVLDENKENIIESHQDVSNIIDAVENLENAEEQEEDALLDEYEESDEAKEDFENVEESVNIMVEYLENALDLTEEGGDEYYEHQSIREGILRLSGRYDMNQEVKDQTASQQIFEYYDHEMDYDSLPPQSASQPFGGIIKKKDIPFIKNLNKSMQIIKKKYKQRKVKKSKKNVKTKKGTNKSNKAGFKNKYTRSNRKLSYTPFIIKNLNTRRQKKSLKKKTKKCSF
tara:strand:- start:16958 stop:18340 length:1383 start_codon:yes stop_codon:yes gene_type:complete